ncbi:coiled-coil domain-containing protein 173-like isoform X1 [Arapaima gigas]
MASALFARCRKRDVQNNGTIAPSKVEVVEETITPFHILDFCQVAVLPKAEWLRIQDNLSHVNKRNEILQEISKERETLHLRSKEVVKLWSNTITSGLLLTEALKEREAQLALKQKTLNTYRNLDRDAIVALERKDEEAMQQEEDNAKQRRLKNKATAEDLKQQMKEHEHNENLEKLRIRKEAEELLQLQELYNRERNRFEEAQKEQKRRNMNVYKASHWTTKDLLKALDAKREKMEEERRRLIITGKEKMQQLRKEKEREILRDVQRRNEALLERVSQLERQKQQEETSNEEASFTNAVAQREARFSQEEKEKDEKNTAMLTAIALHRKAKQQEEEKKESEEKQKDLNILHSAKEADRFFEEEELLRVQKMKEGRKSLQDAHIRQMVENYIMKQLEKNEEIDFNTKTEELIANEEKWFQIYAKQVIDRAEETARNTYPLNKAARKGSGGGLGPVIGGVRPSYLVQP